MFENLAVRVKVLLLTCVMLVIAVVIAGIGIYYNSQSESKVEEMYNSNLMTTQYLNDANNHLRAIDVDAAYLLLRNYVPSDRQLLLDDMTGRLGSIQGDIAKIKEIDKSERAQEAIGQIEQSLSDATAKVGGIKSYGTEQSDRVKMFKDLQSIRNVENALAVLTPDNVFQGKQLYGEAMVAYSRSIKFFIAIIVIGLVVGTIFALMIAFYALTILQEQKRIKLKLAAEERNHGVTYSMVSGIQKIKVSGSEKRAFARWLEGYAIQSKADYTIYVPFAFRDQILATISCIGTLCFYYITYRNQLSVAQFTAFISAFGLVSGAISAMGSIGSSFSNLKPALDMGEDILQTLPECTQDLTKVEKITGRVELNEVSFRYSQDTPLILDAVSLLIQPGEYVALVGKSGCGKSTIMKLLLGFEQPVQGTVSLDGTDINKLDLRSMRSHIGTVMQDRRLFSGDILTNITIADRRLTIDDAWAAAEKAGIAEDIRNMPMGMHTHIGENGEGVSGGQKQRILIARAIAPDPGLLLFDEATSALDNISQNVVTDTLSRMKGTRIVIAHRLSTIKECDRIIAIDQGHIVEEGTYDELMSKKGFFAELVERQQRSDME